MTYRYGGPIQRPVPSSRAARASFAKVSLAKREQLLASVPLFADLRKHHLTTIARRTETVRFEPGDEIVSEGDMGDFCAVVVDGKADVLRKGKKVVSLGTGEIFGELALVDPGPRSATVKAATEVVAIKVGQEDFASLVASDPRVALRVMAVLGRRLRETTARLD